MAHACRNVLELQFYNRIYPAWCICWWIKVYYRWSSYSITCLQFCRFVAPFSNASTWYNACAFPSCIPELIFSVRVLWNSWCSSKHESIQSCQSGLFNSMTRLVSVLRHTVTLIELC
jgi:hypothetical protein